MSIGGVIAACFMVAMAWRGLRRGAARTLRGWLPSVVSTALLAGGIWLAFYIGNHLVTSLCIVTVVAGATFLVLHRAMRPGIPHPAPENATVSTHPWSHHANRWGGAVLGAVSAGLVCLAIGLGGTMLLFAYERQHSDDESSASLHQQTRTLRRAFFDIADVGFLAHARHLPGIAENARELRALIRVLNASQEDIERLTESLSMEELLEIPEVQAALEDQAYLDKIQQLSTGNVVMLNNLAIDPRSKALVQCDELREQANRFRPTALHAQLRKLKKLLPNNLDEDASL